MDFHPIPRAPEAFQQHATAWDIQAIALRAFGRSIRITSAVELGGGMCNNTYRLCADGLDGPVILRIAPAPQRQFASPAYSPRIAEGRAGPDPGPRSGTPCYPCGPAPSGGHLILRCDLQDTERRQHVSAPCSWIRTDTSATHPPQPLTLVSPTITTASTASQVKRDQ